MHSSKSFQHCAASTLFGLVCSILTHYFIGILAALWLAVASLIQHLRCNGKINGHTIHQYCQVGIPAHL